MKRPTLILLLLFLAFVSCNEKVKNEVATTLVKRGTFTGEIIEIGTLKAVNSISVTTPNISYRFSGLKITKLVSDGEEVNRGDTLVVFDPSEVKKSIIEAEQRIEIENSTFEKLKETQKSEIMDLEADLEISKLSYEIAKINYEQAEFESEIRKKEMKLSLDNSNLAIQRAKELIENRKKIQKEELVQRQNAMNQMKAQLDDANKSMNNLFIISPENGIALLETNFMSGQKWGLGDQPFTSSKLIELPDLSEMMAVVNVSEVDVTKLEPGMKVEIKPDAYADSVFTGKINSIANLAQSKSGDARIKVFPVEISINGTSRKLLPGLTVSCRIITDEIPDTVFVPLIAVFKDQSGEHVFVKSRNTFEKRNIKVGKPNSDYILVHEGLKGNEELALSNPFENKEDESKKEKTSKSADK